MLRRQRQGMMETRVDAVMSCSLRDANLLDMVVAFLDPFERVVAQRVSCDFDAVARQQQKSHFVESLSVAFESETWKLGDEMETEDDDSTFAGRSSALRVFSSVTWSGHKKKGSIWFDHRVCSPRLLSLGLPRMVAIHGAPSASAMEELLESRAKPEHDVALRICNWSLEADDSMADVAMSLQNLAPNARSLLWWNPEILLEAAVFAIGTMTRLRSMTLVLHGAEFDDPRHLTCLARLHHRLPELEMLTILPTSALAPQFPAPVPSFTLGDPRQLRHLAVGLCGIPQLRELSFPSFHTTLTTDTVWGAAPFVADVLAYLPNLARVGVLPCDAKFWRQVHAYAVRYPKSIQRKLFFERPKIHLEIVGRYPYAKDLAALVACLVGAFRGRSVHLDLRLDVLLFETCDDCYLFETDLDAHTLVSLLCGLQKSKAAAIEVSLDANLPHLDRAEIEPPLADHGIHLRSFTRFST